MTPSSSCSNTSRCSCLPIESPRHERAEANRFYCDLSKLLTLRTARIIKWLCFYVTKPGVVFYSAIVNDTVAISKFCVYQHHPRDRFLPSAILSVLLRMSPLLGTMCHTAPHISFTYSSPSGRTEESRDFHLAALLYQGGEISPG